MIYELIGRLVVRLVPWRLVVGFVRWRYGDQIRNAAFVGAGLAAVAAVAYVATREDEEE
jgi:hypothetical protein